MVKEQIIAILQKQGFDTITACEIATGLVAELRAKAPGLYTYQVGKTNIEMTFRVN